MTYVAIEIKPGDLLSSLKGSEGGLTKSKLFSELLKAERITVQPISVYSYINTLSKLEVANKTLGYQDSKGYKVKALVSVLEDHNIEYSMTEFTL